MLSSGDGVRCTIHDDEMWMHLDNTSVKVPPQLVKKSQFLSDALSVGHPSVTRKVTLPAPKEWLQAWAVCYCNEEESIICEDINVLVNCLLVCFLYLERSFHRARNLYSSTTVFAACPLQRPTLNY
jgi:hypothetical protein